jgi:protein-S-isoprenylcysteine O-methyltransferase Ste14
MVIIAWGAVAWWGAASAIVVPVVLAWILSRRFIAPEEAALRRAFGPEAETYFTATRRWV